MFNFWLCHKRVESQHLWAELRGPYREINIVAIEVNDILWYKKIDNKKL